MTAVVDQVAEAAVAGVAMISADGCRAVMDLVDLGDFHDRRFAEVVRAAANLDGVRWSTDELLERGSIDRRVDAVATRTGLPRAWLARIVDHTPVLHDRAGVWCERVRVAASARRRVLQLCGEIERYGLKLIVEIPDGA